MGILALTADERVADVKFTKDTLSVGLQDGRTITVPILGCSTPLLPSGRTGGLQVVATEFSGRTSTRT